MSRQGSAKRVLFVQGMDPAAYPPIMHAAIMLADAGWSVVVLSAPSTHHAMSLPHHVRIRVRTIRTRPSHVMRKTDYFVYTVFAAWIALTIRPQVIYASDPLSAAPGLLAATLTRASLVYHEHDSPAPGALRPWLARLRRSVARKAQLVIFPNAERARIVQADIGIAQEQLRTVWNVPRLGELPPVTRLNALPLIAYFHGSITPDRLPEAVIEGVKRLGGAVRLRIAGYEAPGAPGYIARLLALGDRQDGEPLVEYIGQINLREDLLKEAAQAHVGLAFMPESSCDINMRHMTGASNKVFDYMAAGLAILVSDLPDWRDTFCVPGYARPCNPNDAGSVATALRWFINNIAECREIMSRNRAKIEADWNYENAFAAITEELSGIQCIATAESRGKMAR